MAVELYTTRAVSNTYMFLSTTKEIWEAVFQTYSNVGMIAQIYEIKCKAHDIKQVNLSVTEYYNAMKGLWLEMDQYQSFKMKCVGDDAILQKFLKREDF